VAVEKLVTSLRKNEQAQKDAIWQQVKSEADALKQQAELRRKELGDLHEQELQAAVRRAREGILRESAAGVRNKQLDADRALAEQLRRIALDLLAELWQQDRAHIFAGLVGELPQRAWSEVRVHPLDHDVAVKYFSADHVRTDEGVEAGFIAIDREQGLTVDARLAVRLDAIWDQLLPGLLEVCREPALE